MSRLLLDTHYWIWLQMANTARLGRDEQAVLLQAQRTRELYASAISVLEIARLVAEGDLELGTTVDRFVEDGTHSDGLQLLALTPRILIESTRLPGDLHRDPADRILAATAREHGLTLLTRDKALIVYARQGYISARKL